MFSLARPFAPLMMINSDTDHSGQLSKNRMFFVANKHSQPEDLSSPAACLWQCDSAVRPRNSDRLHGDLVRVAEQQQGWAR